METNAHRKSGEDDHHGIRNVADVALVEFSGEPRACDLDVGERLGFDRPRDIRKLIERNIKELEQFGVCATVARPTGKAGGRPTNEFWLNEEQVLLVSAISNAPNAPAVRSMLIRVFVAWRRGHLTIPSQIDADHLKATIRREIAEGFNIILPAMLKGALSEADRMVRHGRTAGQIYRDAGFPPIKGISAWLGNTFVKLGFQVPGNGKGELGLSTARMFDPDKVSVWMANGGRLAIERKVAERRSGQGRLQLVQPTA